MAPCRCGHGRHAHYPTTNAVRKNRRNRYATPPRSSCHAYGPAGRRGPECPCRAYVPQAQEVTR